MSDAAVSDTAGPSTVTGSEIEQELEVAELNFQQGIQAIKANNLDQAVELFGQVLQSRCQLFGDINIKCASTYFRYGAALFYKAQDEQDVFGSSLQAATAQEEADVADEEESEDEKENVDDKGKKPMREEDLPQEQAEADEEAADSPGSRTDMELAWENLEVAKYIYEHEPDGNHAKELADIHTLLADIGMEQESFESAMIDHKRALELLSSILQADDRRLAELHYKMSLTLQYLDQPEDALKEIEIAVKIVEARIDNIKAATAQSLAAEPGAAAASTSAAAAGSTAAEAARPSAEGAAETSQQSQTPATGTADASANRQEVADLESVLEDMYEKVEELQQVLKEHVSTKNALKAAFSQIAGSLGPPQLGQGSSAGAGPSSAPSAVVDLGVVGRGTKRVTPLPMPIPTLPATAGTATTSKPLPQKRSLEELMSGGPVSGTARPAAFGSSSSTGTVSIGFGSGSHPATGFGGSALRPVNSPWPPAPAGAKKQKTGLTEKSSNATASGQSCAVAPASQTVATEGVSGKTASAAALPAFLQPANVTAAYGKEASPTHKG